MGVHGKPVACDTQLLPDSMRQKCHTVIEGLQDSVAGNGPPQQGVETAVGVACIYTPQ